MFISKPQNVHELITLIKIGDEAAFTQFFNHYRDLIYNAAYKLTHSTSIAEEIVAEVFLKVWLRRTELTNIQNISAYLFTIARNEVYRVLKNNVKNYKVSEVTEFSQPGAKNTDDYLLEREYDSLLLKAINQLPNQQKKVYQLIKEQDMKRDTVATMLGIHPETVKFHLAQAMRSIRAFCIPYLKTSIGISFILYY